jgi:hypothetical protein
MCTAFPANSAAITTIDARSFSCQVRIAPRRSCAIKQRGFTGHHQFEHGHTMRPDTAAVTQSKPLQMSKQFYFDTLTHRQGIPHSINRIGANV